jgi:hypothetical protein
LEAAYGRPRKQPQATVRHMRTRLTSLADGRSACLRVCRAASQRREGDSFRTSGSEGKGRRRRAQGGKKRGNLGAHLGAHAAASH